MGASPWRGSTCAGRARRRGSPATSTTPRSRRTWSRPSPGSRHRSGRRAASGCTGRPGEGSTRSRSRWSGRPRSGRSSRSTPRTTATPTTSTTWAGCSRRSTSWTGSCTWPRATSCPRRPRSTARAGATNGAGASRVRSPGSSAGSRSSTVGGRLHEHRAPRLRGAHVPSPRPRRAAEPHVARDVDPGPPRRPRPRARPLVRPLAPRRAQRHRRGAVDRGLRAALDAARARSPRAPRRVALGADVARRAAARDPAPSVRQRRRPAAGPRRRRRRRLDLLRRQAAVDAPRRPA